MARSNRYTPEFKADAVVKYEKRRAEHPGESKASSLQFTASKLNVSESTLDNWVRGPKDRPAEATPNPIPEHTPKDSREGREKRWRVVPLLALGVSLLAMLLPQLGIPTLRDGQEEQQNAQSYFEAVTGPNPDSWEASAIRYTSALSYTEPNSPAARLLTMMAGFNRVFDRANAEIETTKGSIVTRIDDGYRTCAIDDSNDCQSYYALEFDEENRLRTYSFENNQRLDSMLLNKEEGFSENEDFKVSLIDGFEGQTGAIIFAAQVTNKQFDEVATIDFASAEYAVGGQKLPAEVVGPPTLGPNESVTIAGMVDHNRGITLTLQVTLQSEGGKDSARTSPLLIKLF